MSKAQGPVPRTLLLTVRESGGGTEQNARRLADSVPAFRHVSLEALMGWPLQWGRLPQALRRLRRLRPRVVFCFGATAHVAAVLAWPFGGPALVRNIRGERDFAGLRALVPLLLGWRFRAVATNARVLLPRGRGIVIRNGAPAPPAGEEALLPDLPRPVIGLLARGAPEKGHEFLAGLWNDLGRPGTLVFGGRLGSGLRRRCEARGVVCTGWVEPGPFLRGLDLLCIPSTTEGSPTVIPEAMHRGVPILATPVGGIPETIRHGRTGYLLPRERWGDFLRSIDWDEARQVGTAGCEFASSRLTFDAQARAFIALSRRLASE